MKKNLFCFTGLLCNLTAFVPALLFVLYFGTTEAGIAVGSIFLVFGIILAIVSHLACRDHPAAWAVSIVMLGISKGGCGGALILHFEMETGWKPAALGAAAAISACAVIALCACFILLSHILPAVKNHPKRLFLPLLLLLVTAATVLLCTQKSLPALLFLLNCITLMFCWIPGMMECDCIRELRFYVNMASMMYAILLLVITLLVIGSCCGCCDGCDGDCGGACDCGDCCDCSGGGDGKKQKIIHSPNLNNQTPPPSP